MFLFPSSSELTFLPKSSKANLVLPTHVGIVPYIVYTESSQFCVPSLVVKFLRISGK